MFKKLSSIFLAMVIALSVCCIPVSAEDVAKEFTSKFFPDGKIDVPTDIYYQIKRNDDDKAEYVYAWLTQPDDIISFFNEYKNIDDYEKFYELYHCNIDLADLQIDCKVDDGDWHYMTEWDKDEYPQEDQPYDLTIRQKIVASDSQKTYCEGCAIIDPYYGQDEENAGYLAPVIKKDKDDEYYLDLDNHSLTLRMRYILIYRNDNLTDEELEANGGDNRSYLLSDWSDEIKIGKDGTQADLVKPEKIEAPVISELKHIESQKEEDGSVRGRWRVFCDYPKSCGDANKYYAVVEDQYSALNAILQYRVQKNGTWGEWQETYWGNSDWIDSGWKEFETDGVEENDTIEFRAALENNADDSMGLLYSESLFCNADKASDPEPVVTTIAETGEEPDIAAPVTTQVTEEKKCSVCGICPVQPLGICLFIWLAIIIVVIIIVIIIIKKSKKNNNEKK